MSQIFHLSYIGFFTNISHSIHWKSMYYYTDVQKNLLLFICIAMPEKFDWKSLCDSSGLEFEAV